MERFGTGGRARQNQLSVDCNSRAGGHSTRTRYWLILKLRCVLFSNLFLCCMHSNMSNGGVYQQGMSVSTVWGGGRSQEAWLGRVYAGKRQEGKGEGTQTQGDCT